jgi:hypothetical protein
MCNGVSSSAGGCGENEQKQQFTLFHKSFNNLILIFMYYVMKHVFLE